MAFTEKPTTPNPKHLTELFGASVADENLTTQGRERNEQASVSPVLGECANCEAATGKLMFLSHQLQF